MYTKILAKWRAKEAEEAKSLQRPNEAQPVLLPGHVPIPRAKKTEWVLPSGDGFEEKQSVLLRVRKVVNAARQQHGFTWEHLFSLCDEDRSGTLTWKEFRQMARGVLHIQERTLSDTDLGLLFDEVNTNGGFVVNLGQLLDYLARGPQEPEVLAARKQQRILRVRRNIQLAFSRLNSSEGEIKKLFEKIDLDSSNRLSQYEFTTFVRSDLGLSHWDILASDLEEFYGFMDRDGDGIDVDEFLDYVKKVNKSRHSLGGQNYSLPKSESDSRLSRRKQKTYKDTIEEDLRQKVRSSPVIKVATPFLNTGRDRKPASRAAATSGSFF